MYLCIVFFFNDTATTEIYTLSLHDALPIWRVPAVRRGPGPRRPVDLLHRRPALDHRRVRRAAAARARVRPLRAVRSEEHTSELQSRQYLVCRLLLEKKKNTVWNCNI